MPPPVLFQGDYLSSAIENVGNSLLKVGETIYDKVREAKTTSDIISGQQILSDQVNQFNRALAQDTEYEKYGEKWTEYKDQAWGNVLKTIKDPGALNTLNQWWNTQSIEQGRRVNEYAINGQMGKLHSDVYTQVTVAANRDLPFEQNDSEVNRILASKVKTGIMSPDEARSLYDKVNKEMATRDFNKQGLQFLQQNGALAFRKWVTDPANVPEITDMSQRSLLANGVVKGFNAVQNLQLAQAKANNDKVSEQIAHEMYAPDGSGLADTKDEKGNTQTIFDRIDSDSRFMDADGDKDENGNSMNNGVSSSDYKKQLMDKAYSLTQALARDIKAKAKPIPLSSQKDILQPLVDEVIKNEASLNNEGILELDKKAIGLTSKGVRTDGLTWFHNWLSGMSKFSTDTRASLRDLSVVPGTDDSATVEAKHKAYASVADILISNPQIQLDQVKVRQLVSDQLESEKNAVIKKAVASVSSGAKSVLGTIWDSTLGGKSIQEVKTMGKKMMDGTTYQSTTPESVTFVENFNKAAAIDLKDKAKLTVDPTILRDKKTGRVVPPRASSHETTNGVKRDGQHPMVAAHDGKGWYHLWMEADGSMKWYFISNDDYGNLKDSWKPIQ